MQKNFKIQRPGKTARMNKTKPKPSKQNNPPHTPPNKNSNKLTKQQQTNNTKLKKRKKPHKNQKNNNKKTTKNQQTLKERICLVPWFLGLRHRRSKFYPWAQITWVCSELFSEQQAHRFCLHRMQAIQILPIVKTIYATNSNI